MEWIDYGWLLSAVLIFCLALIDRFHLVTASSVCLLFIVSIASQPYLFYHEYQSYIFYPVVGALHAVTAFVIYSYQKEVIKSEMYLIYALLGVVALATARYIDAWYIQDYKMGFYRQGMILLNAGIIGACFYPHKKTINRKDLKRGINGVFGIINFNRLFNADFRRSNKNKKNNK